MVVELNEQVMIPLDQYYSGPLINYQLTIRDESGNIKDNDDIRQMINITEPFQQLVSQNIREEFNAQFSDQPFPRSTIFVNEEYENKMSMYMLDRRYMFIRYDATGFSQQVITKIYEVQLDTQLINERCSDLNLIKNEVNYLLLFCLSQVQTSKGHFATQITVVKLQLYNKDSKPRIQYLSFFQQKGDPSLYFGLEWMGIEQNEELITLDSLVFMTKQIFESELKTEEKICLTLFKLENFLSMDQKGLDKLTLPEGETPF